MIPTEDANKMTSDAEWSEWQSSIREIPNTSRPTWEPPLYAASDYSEEGPIVNHDAHENLRKQGCQCHTKHYTAEHRCLIPGIRLQCIRDILRWQRYRYIVELMVTKLPEELILGILEYVARETQSNLHLEHKRSLAMAARAIIGESPVVDQLQPLAEEAVLNTSVITLNIAFQGDQSGKVAVLDSFIKTLQHPIRHLELLTRVSIPYQRQAYPAALYIASAGVKSLLSQLPHLQTLQLVVCVTLDGTPGDSRFGIGDVLNLGCRKGFSGTTTYKKAMVDLVDAARAIEHGPCVSLELRYGFLYEDPNRPWRRAGHPDQYRIAAGVRPALEVVEEAHAKYQW